MKEYSYVTCTLDVSTSEATCDDGVVTCQEGHSNNIMLQGILLGGDQLSCSMARRVIADRINSMNDAQCLKGLIPVVEDWHSKLCLLTVSNA